MACKRSESQHHALPKYVYIRRGWYVYREHLGKGKFGKDIKLCPADALISEVWQRYESLTCAGAPRKTLDWLMTQYLESPQFKEKSPNTQQGYRKNFRQLSQTQTYQATFSARSMRNALPLECSANTWTRVPHPSPPIGNLRFCRSAILGPSSAICSKPIPAKTFARNTDKARTRYVTEQGYRAVFDLASKWSYVQCTMEFAYLLRMRLCEVLDLKQSDITETGIHVRRRKGSRDNMTLWSPRLEAAVKLSRSLPFPAAVPTNPHLIRGATGHKLTESGF